MITADLVRAVSSSPCSWCARKAMVWLVYPLLLLETIMAAFFEPARSSVIPNITPREDVIIASTLGSHHAVDESRSRRYARGYCRCSAWPRRRIHLERIVLSGIRIAAHGNELCRTACRGGESFTAGRVVSTTRRSWKECATSAGNGAWSPPCSPRPANLVIGPSWVLFTVMGQKYFPVRWHNMDPQRGAMLGMSFAARSTRTGVPSSDQLVRRALGGPSGSALAPW